jgi:hypothetical protein
MSITTNTNNFYSNKNRNITNNNMNNNKSPIIHVSLSVPEQVIKTEFINDLQNFMFFTKNLSRFTKLQSHNLDDKLTKEVKSKNNNYKNNQNNNQVTAIKKKQDTFICHLKDNLFWCLYVIKMGIDKYDMIGNQHFVIEKEMKFKYIELLRSKKDLLKINKIKPLYELEDDLANKAQISLKTFVALCIIENINILIVDKKKVFEYIYNDENDIYIIKKPEDSNSLKYILDLNNIKVTDDKIKEFRENYYQLTHIDSSIKSMTSYKLDELTEIANKLGINISSENNKKKTKKEIYEIIILNF